MVSERVAVAAAGSVLRGSLRIGRAMAAAVGLVDLLYASPGLAGASRLIHAADGARLALGLLGAELLVLLGAQADLEQLPRPARPRDRRRSGDAVARARDRAHYHGLQPAHDRALDDQAATNRPGPKPAASTDLFVLPGDRRLLLAAVPPDVLEHGLGTGEEGQMSRHQRWPAAGPRAGSRPIMA